jgi:hypothetical protein
VPSKEFRFLKFLFAIDASTYKSTWIFCLWSSTKFHSSLTVIQ